MEGKTLKSFLEIQGVFENILNYYESLNNSNNDLISNIVPAVHWKSKLNTNSDNIHFPLLIFYDDFEIGNALGSLASIQKLGAVYATLPIVPPKYISTLENIFFSFTFSLFRSKKIRKYNNFFKINC